ncbi:MAG: hypothetical protein LLG04_00100 [Parachlamydia sp.]|nr:hypothetical protein [Parachlamydia sp.]
MISSTHSVSPSGSSREDGELRSDPASRKRSIDPHSTAARTPLPQPLPESSGKRFHAERDNIRYARPENWRRVAEELTDLKRLAEKNCDLNDMRAEHFEVKSIELEKQVDEARQKIQLLETKLREAQSSASTWQLKAEQTEKQLQQASMENKEFESQLTIAEQAIIDKTESAKKLTARVTELIQQRDQINSKLNQLQKDNERLSKLQAYQEQQSTSSEQTIATLRKEKAKLAGTANTQLTSIQELKVKCQRAIEEKTAAENTLAQIQHSLQETQQKLAEEEKKASGLRQTLGMIRAQADAKLVKQERT